MENPIQYRNTDNPSQMGKLDTTKGVVCHNNLSLCIGGSRGGRARHAPPHLPGILVFDDILGHTLADLGGARPSMRPPICLAS